MRQSGLVRDRIIASQNGSHGWASKAVVLLWLVWASAGWAQVPDVQTSEPVGGYLFDNWQLEQGLPQNTVNAIVQGPAGYLWFGTEEGLVRFDGLRFTVFDRGNTPQLRSNIVQALEPDRDGGLWIGTPNGLNRWHDGQFTLYTAEDGLAENEVQTLHQARDGDLWVGTSAGISRFDGQSFVSYAVDDGLIANSVRAIHDDHQGSLWIGTELGLSRLSDNRFTSYTTEDGLSHNWILALEEDHQGHLWIGTFGGLDRMVDGRVSGSYFEGLAHPTVRALHENSDGVLWIGTEGGLSRLADNTLAEVAGQPAVVTENLVWSLWKDLQGSLWIGTRSAGLARLRPRQIDVLGATEGLADDLVWTVYEDSAGVIWVGTNSGLTRIDPDGGRRSFGISYVIRSIFEDRHGELWIGTNSHGPARLEDDELRTFQLVAGPAQPRTNCFSEDAAGDLWIGTLGGLFRREGKQWTDQTAAAGLPSPIVRDLYLDPGGVLWIASHRGLGRYTDDTFELFGVDQGLPVDSLTSIYGDPDGTLWIGTVGAGLVRFRDGLFTTISVAPGFFDVFATLEDDSQHLWMSSNRGIVSVAKAQLEDFSQGLETTIDAISYGTHEGMRSRECNGGSQPAGWRASDGRLWFPTMRGVAIIDPRGLGLPEVSPEVVIEAVLLGGVEIETTGDGPLELPHGARNLEVRYSAPSFVAAETIQFRYRLEGLDNDWVDAGTRRSAFYTNLAPGSYRLRVSARSRNGAWNEIDEPFELYLRPAFYQTGIFYGICAAAAAGLLWASHRLRVRSLLSQSRLHMLEARNAEMERFTYTVSHDLKSPLVTIQGFLGFLKKDLAAGHEDRVQRSLERIANAATQMGRMLDELLELSRLGHSVAAKETVPLNELATAAVDLVAGQIAERGVEVIIPTDLPVVRGDRRRLLQVFQNLLDNGIKFMGDQTTPQIEIGADQNKNETVCFVRDNGVGIEPDQRDKIFGLFDQLDPEAKGTGIGLALVERIIRLHGGRVWVESKGAGQGSTFYFTIPTAATDG